VRGGGGGRGCRGIIVATTQAKLVPPAHSITVHACGGHLTYVPLFQQPARHLKYMYGTLLVFSLFGRYHACLCHTGDPTFTCSL
jgi:hypothetical protein